MIDNNWILAFRTDYLTIIFKYFPLIANDYFYISIIALGYWLRPASILFKSLGFLIPFSTLLNCLLKNLFRIPRPDKLLYLIPMDDSFGFPSGDVQVAMVFWGYILMNSHNIFKYLYFIPIIGIAISRIYLGVHSVFDVGGAIIIGLLILYIWQYLEKKLLYQSFTIINKGYWMLFIIIVTTYIILSYGVKWPLVAPASIGALIGFGVSLKGIINSQFHRKMSFLTSGIFLGIVIIISLVFPIDKVNLVMLYLSLILKYSIIIICIFYFIPKIYFRYF